MIKRRRLADKLTIMVCAVLIAVSAFFYAPMDVRAEEVVSLSTTTDITSTGLERYICENKGVFDSRTYDFSSYLDGDGLYKITFNFSANYYCLSELSSYPFWLNAFTCMNTSDSYYQMSSTSSTWQREFNYSNNNFTIYLNSDAPVVQIAYFFVAVFQNNVAPTVDFSMNYSISDIVVTKVLDEDSEEYQNGYNAGYSAGEQAGYGNGYSQGFTDGEASVDTDAIYDEAFQAGKDSVDTQSYYDAGYQAGYQVAYSEGYESGYDVGYQSAMDRIESWGADTTDYPVLLYDNSLSNLKLFCDVKTGYPQVAYGDYYLPQFNFNVDPNHTYKVVFNSSQYTYTSAYFSGSQRADLVYNMGFLELPWNVGESFAFVQGSSFTSNVRLQSYIYSSISDGSSSGQAVITLNSLNVKVYDYGPSGNTQNHISNQTDQLTGGYNDSQGNSVNNDFSAGLNDFETAEDSLFATATTGLKDFTFFDIQSVPAMVTGMSFVGSIMSGWFSQAGGASGVGIVLSILFSIMLVAMVLGLYRWYQSKGGKD